MGTAGRACSGAQLALVVTTSGWEHLHDSTHRARWSKSAGEVAQQIRGGYSGPARRVGQRFL